MPGPEHAPNPEHGTEKLKHIERAPEALDKTERSPAESPEEAKKNIEKARTEAQHEAIASNEVDRDEKKASGTEHAPQATHQQSYKHTMKTVRAELSAPERTFSKVIHNPVVERVSDTVGKTVARPDALLSGSVFAGISVLGLYIMARFYGFELRGSETILAFVVGWVFGVVFDMVRGAIKRNRP